MNVELKPIDSLSRETLTDLIYSIFPETHSHWETQREIEESFNDMVEMLSAIAWEGYPGGTVGEIEGEGHPQI